MNQYFVKLLLILYLLKNHLAVRFSVLINEPNKNLYKIVYFLMKLCVITW